MEKPRKGQVWRCDRTLWGCDEAQILEVHQGQVSLLFLGSQGGDTMTWELRNWNKHWTRKG